MPDKENMNVGICFRLIEFNALRVIVYLLLCFRDMVYSNVCIMMFLCYWLNPTHLVCHLFNKIFVKLL